MYPSDSLVASPDMVSLSTTSVLPPICVSPNRSIIPGRLLQHPPTSEAHGVASGLAFSAEVQNVLLNSRKPSTRWSYKAKWGTYQAFLMARSLSSSSLSSVFDFLMDRRAAGLSYSSLRVYLSAISAYHPLIDQRTVFSHLSSKTFLRGFRNLYPLVHPPPLAWDLSLVLRQFME